MSNKLNPGNVENDKPTFFLGSEVVSAYTTEVKARNVNRVGKTGEGLSYTEKERIRKNLNNSHSSTRSTFKDYQNNL